MNHELIQKITNYLIGKPVIKAWIFGSVSRGEDTVDSDIDLLVEFDSSAEVDLFDHVGMIQDLEELLGRPVDLVSEGTLFPWIKKYVDIDKKLIYERTTA